VFGRGGMRSGESRHVHYLYVIGGLGLGGGQGREPQRAARRLIEVGVRQWTENPVGVYCYDLYG